MNITINQALVLQKTVRERIADLKRLRSDVSNKHSYLYSHDEKKVVEPQYDVKAVDKKVTELEKFIFFSDSAIKASNATTTLGIDFDMDSLLSPIS